MKYIAVTIALFMFSVINVAGQLPFSESQFRAFDAKGSPVTVANIVTAAGEADVTFLGELHDDAVAHAIQAEMFRRIYAAYGTSRKVTLSLEMFERDVQVVVNEYLDSKITEKHFLDASRPWGNYKTDYRPLVEFAKEKKLRVIAANAPRRYVNMVSRGGREALAGLSKQAKDWLPRLPYGEPSPAYSAKFKALMGPSPEAQMGIDKILASQTLWDAAMADAIAKSLKRGKRSLVVHLNGGFHTESRLGTVEHLLNYRPKTKVIVVTMLSADNIETFDQAKHAGLGDFVILTDAKVPRSKR